MKGKGFADVTEGVNSVRGSTLVVLRVGVDQLQASAGQLRLAAAGRDVQQASRRRHIFGKGTTRPLLPCTVDESRHEGRSQSETRQKGIKKGTWALVAHRRQRQAWRGRGQELEAMTVARMGTRCLVKGLGVTFGGRGS